MSVSLVVLIYSKCEVEYYNWGDLIFRIKKSLYIDYSVGLI